MARKKKKPDAPRQSAYPAAADSPGPALPAAAQASEGKAGLSPPPAGTSPISVPAAAAPSASSPATGARDTAPPEPPIPAPGAAAPSDSSAVMAARDAAPAAPPEGSIGADQALSSPPGPPALLGPSTAGGCLIHLAWKALGPVMLVALLAVILAHQPPIGACDLAYLVVTTLVVGARRWDFHTAAKESRPASAEDFRRFTVQFPVGAGVVLILARVLGRLTS